jgi:drug/metabolite transporter (DMT)-like permease
MVVSNFSDIRLNFNRSLGEYNDMNTKTLGSGYILLSALFYGSYGIWSRLMVGSFGEFSQAWSRGLMLLVVVLLLNWRLKFIKKVERHDWKWFLTIALAGGLNQAPYFLGFEHLTIGTATLLFYAALVVGGYILGKVFFAEKLTIDQVASLVIAIVGMVVIYGLTLTPEQLFPASMTVMAGLMGASTVILPKKLVGNYHELQIMAGYFVMQVLFNYPLAQMMGDQLPALELNTAWGGQLSYAGAMMIANLAAIKGFSYLEPSIGSLLGLAEVIFGVMFGVLLFGEATTVGVWVGGAMIVVAAVLPSIGEPNLRGQSSQA